MNFNQWKGHAAKGEVGRVTYVCGDQDTLVEIVVDDIKTILQVPATDFIQVDSTASFWELASQYSLDPEANRLIVVREAEKIRDWSELQEWIQHSRTNPRNYLLFVADESDGPSVYAKGKRVSYEDHIELIRTKGKFIKCSQPNNDDLVSWCLSYGLTQTAAQALIERTASDTSVMMNVLRKVHVWNGSPSPEALALLCNEQAVESFVDNLILKDKRKALLALQQMSDEDKARIIGKLDYHLDMILDIGRCVRKRMYDVDTAGATGIKIYLVKKFKPVVKEYDEKKLRYCRQLLAVLDSAMVSGARQGTWEMLVTLW